MNGQKKKVQKDKQRSTKHTHKTKDRLTRTPLCKSCYWRFHRNKDWMKFDSTFYIGAYQMEYKVTKIIQFIK
jgi:hypothetical protein